MSETATAPQSPPLTDAPPAEGPPPEAKPSVYRAEFLIETPEGYHVMLVGEQLRPRDVLIWIQTTSQELAKHGLKPVRRDTVVNVAAPVAPAAAAAAASGEAVWIKEAGKPPRCSLHGTGKWLEGTTRTGANAGKPYAFWACQTRDCKPKGEPA